MAVCFKENPWAQRLCFPPGEFSWYLWLMQLRITVEPWCLYVYLLPLRKGLQVARQGGFQFSPLLYVWTNEKRGKDLQGIFLLITKGAPCCFLSCFQADLGPDKYLSDKDFQCLIKLLPSCSVSTSPSVILVLMTDPQCFLMGDHGQKSWKQSTGSEERRGREDFRSG